MTTEAQLLSLFEEGNPVPDIDRLELLDVDATAYLTTLSTRSSDMTQLDDKIDQPTIERRLPRARRLVAAAAFALGLTIGAGIVWLAASGSDLSPADEPSTTEAPSTTSVTTTTAVPTTTISAPAAAVDEGAVAAVEASIALLNSGDLDSYIESLGGDFRNYVVRQRSVYESHAAAGMTTEFLQPCQVLGIGVNGGTLVQCELLREDDFTKPAGVFEEGLAVYSVLDGEIVDEQFVAVSNDPGEMPVAFWVWFHQAHPAEAEAIGSLADDVNALMDSAAVMEVFLQYVDEFVAQSDVYPRGG